MIQPLYAPDIIISLNNHLEYSSLNCSILSKDNKVKVVVQDENGSREIFSADYLEADTNQDAVNDALVKVFFHLAKLNIHVYEHHNNVKLKYLLQKKARSILAEAIKAKEKKYEFEIKGWTTYLSLSTWY